MISELRLLFFASAIYFLINYFGMFKHIDGAMKGQDELMILSVKVGSTILILYLLIHFSKKTRVVEGNKNGDIQDFYEKMEQAIRERDGTTVINLVETNIEDMTDWMAYGTASSECNKHLNPKNDDIAAAIRCMKRRLVDPQECHIKSLNQKNECIIGRIMESIHILGDKDRKEGYNLISSEIMNDNKIIQKMRLSNTFDNLIISIQKDQNYHIWIEYILELYRDILQPNEIKYLESVKNKK